jgi:hypothetical protein
MVPHHLETAEELAAQEIGFQNDRVFLVDGVEALLRVYGGQFIGAPARLFILSVYDRPAITPGTVER